VAQATSTDVCSRPEKEKGKSPINVSQVFENYLQRPLHTTHPLTFTSLALFPVQIIELSPVCLQKRRSPLFDRGKEPLPPHAVRMTEGMPSWHVIDDLLTVRNPSRVRHPRPDL